MKTDIIGQAWTDYQKLIPAQASKAQRRDTQHAFYAGGLSVYTAIMEASGLPGDETPETEARAMATLAAIQAELQAFAVGLAAAYGGRK